MPPDSPWPATSRFAARSERLSDSSYLIEHRKRKVSLRLLRSRVPPQDQGLRTGPSHLIDEAVPECRAIGFGFCRFPSMISRSSAEPCRTVRSAREPVALLILARRFAREVAVAQCPVPPGVSASVSSFMAQDPASASGLKKVLESIHCPATFS